MSLKAKLVSVISMFILVLALLIVGVFALNQENLSLGGTINFQATNVYARVSATCSGTAGDVSFTTLVFSANELENSSSKDVESWSGKTLSFGEDSTSITFEIKIENLSERTLYAKITDLLPSSVFNKTIVANGQNVDGQYLEVAGLSQINYTITISLINSNESVSEAYSFAIELSDSSVADDFDIQISTYTNDESLGSAFSEGPYKIGDTTFILANPNGGSTFLGWSKEGFDGPIFSTDNILEFTVEIDSPTKLYAIFSSDGGTTTYNGIIYNLYPEAGFAEVLGSTSGTEFSGDLIIPESFESGGITYIPYKISDNAFDYGENITSVSLPNGISIIGSYAFRNCLQITNLSLPSTLRIIDGYAFYNLTSLSSLIIPEGVVEISNSSFEGCTNVTSLTLPESLERIGSSAFMGCIKLKELIIPKNVVSIGENAFYACGAEEIKIESNIQQLGLDALSLDNVTKLTIGANVKMLPDSLFSSSNLGGKITEIVLEGSNYFEIREEGSGKALYQKEGNILIYSY